MEARDEERPYDNIPRTGGEHRGEAPEEHSGLNVRAPGPPDRAELTGRHTGRVQQLAYNEKEGHHRVRVGTEDELEEGYEEKGRYTSGDDLAAALSEQPGPLHFAVFEHTETGEAHLERDPDLSGDWTGDGRFNQATLFDNEDDAQAYLGHIEG